MALPAVFAADVNEKAFESGGCWDTREGVSVHLDNDLFAGGRHDADYTGGMALDWTPVNQDPRSGLHSVHSAFDRALHISRPDRCRRHVWQIGLFSLTPGTLRSADPIFDDRPFASLFVLGTTAFWEGASEEVAWQSTLQIGALGLDSARSVHSMLHSLVDDEDPQGYQHQISDGGEPTARYVLARHELLQDSVTRGETLQVKGTSALSVGYLTEASIGLSARWGRISTPWQSFAPEVTDYLPTPVPLAAIGPGYLELYAFAGARVKLRAYNALTQGQFRDSIHVLHASELERWMGEAWFGLHWRPAEHWELTYTARVHTPELRNEPGRRSLVWASIDISRRF